MRFAPAVRIRAVVIALAIANALLPTHELERAAADTPSPAADLSPHPTPPGSASQAPVDIIVDDRDRSPDSTVGTFTVGGAAAGWLRSNSVRDIVYSGGGAYTYAAPRWTPGENNWAKWTPNIPSAGTWEIAAFIPRIFTGRNDTSRAIYRISTGSEIKTVELDQNTLAGRNPGWTALGQYSLPEGSSHFVELRDLTADPFMLYGRSVVQKTVVFDAIRWRNVDSAPQIDLAIRPQRGVGEVYQVGEPLTLCYKTSRDVTLYLASCDADGECISLGSLAARPVSTDICIDNISVPLPMGVQTLRLDAFDNDSLIGTAATNIVVADPASPLPVSLHLQMRGGCGPTLATGDSVDVYWSTNTAGVVEVSSLPDGEVLQSAELHAGEMRVFVLTASSAVGVHRLVARHIPSGTETQCSYSISTAAPTCILDSQPKAATATVDVAPSDPVSIPVSITNSGTCPWSSTEGFGLVRTNKDTPGFPELVPLIQSVPHGAAFETSISGTAPGTPGTYVVKYSLMQAGTAVGLPIEAELTVSSPPSVEISLNGDCGGEFTEGDQVDLTVRVQNAPRAVVSVGVDSESPASPPIVLDVSGTKVYVHEYFIAGPPGSKALIARLGDRSGQQLLSQGNAVTDMCVFTVVAMQVPTDTPVPTSTAGGISSADLIATMNAAVGRGSPTPTPMPTFESDVVQRSCPSPRTSADAGHKVLLIPGFLTSSSQQQTEWANIRKSLSSARMFDLDLDDNDFLYFSYSDRYNCVSGREDFRLPDYSAFDSRHQDDDDIEGYARTVSRILDSYPKSTFTIIGHSQGGAVATYWAGTRGEPYKKRTLVVTLGAPLHGVVECAVLGLFPPYGTVNSSAVLRKMKTGVATIRTLTVAARCDEFIKPELATDTAAWKAVTVGSIGTQCPVNRCPVTNFPQHSGLKYSDDVADYIASAIVPWTTTQSEYYVGSKNNPAAVTVYVTMPELKRNMDAVSAGRATLVLTRGSGGKIGDRFEQLENSNPLMFRLRVSPAPLKSDTDLLMLRIHDGVNPTQYETALIHLRASNGVAALLHQTGVVSENEVVESGTFSVPENQAELRMSLDWPGSALDLELVDPDGNVIIPEYLGSGSARYLPPTYYVLRNATPGTWHTRVRGIDVPEGTTQFSLDVRLPTTEVDRSGRVVVGILSVLVLILVVVMFVRWHRSRAARQALKPS